MLIILEGLDKSGKSFIADMLHQMLPGSLMIRKSYRKELYPINYSIASEYDWQAMFDRIILQNPDTTFIADRSFFTQTMYQMCLGTGAHAITDAQLKMFNAYVSVLTSMPHLVIYCKSNRYEFDSMVTNKAIRAKLDKLFVDCFLNTPKLNFILLPTDNISIVDTLDILTTELKKITDNVHTTENLSKCE